MLECDLNELLGRACAGDFGALERLLKHFRPELAAHLSSKIAPVRAFMDVDDILQETFIDAFRRISSFENRGISSFRSWLFKSARSNLADAIRWRRRHCPEADIPGVDQISAWTETPSAFLRGQERQVAITTRLAAVLKLLPPERAMVVRLRNLEEKKFAEIAAQMGRSIGWVFLAHGRAHEQLRDLVRVLGNQSSLFSSR